METSRLTADLAAARVKYRAALDIYDADGLAPSRKAIVIRALAQTALEKAERALREAQEDAE